MFTKRSILFILVLLSLFQNACFAEKSITQIFKNSPQNVLVGTDVQLLNSFKLAGNISAGQYVAEMGGANLSVDIHENELSLKITRIFQESGLPKESKSYEINKFNKSFIDNSEILLVKVKSGILFLEKKSGSFGIPSDIWVLYTKK